jgi:hypothetical protein
MIAQVYHNSAIRIDDDVVVMEVDPWAGPMLHEKLVERLKDAMKFAAKDYDYRIECNGKVYFSSTGE